MPMSARFLAAAAAALATAAMTAAQDCTAITSTILTSVGCPTVVGSDPCVLYSPAAAASCLQTGRAGTCLSDATYTPPGASATCNVTFQQLDHVVDATTGNWILNLDDNKQTNKITTAPVERVEQVKFPSTVMTIQFGGGTFDSKLHTVSMDSSLFNGSKTVKSLYLIDVDLSTYLTQYQLATQLERISFRHTNLKQVPAQLASLTKLSVVDLSKNSIDKFLAESSDPLLPVFQKVTMLNMSDNALTAFPPTLPALTALDLSGNKLGSIPESVFAMKNLKSLYLSRCGLSNVQVTSAQFDILDSLKTLEVEASFTSCAKGYGEKKLSRNGVSLCVAGLASTTTASKSSSTTIIIVVVLIAVIVVGIIGFVIYRRKHKRLENLEPTYPSKPTLPNDTDGYVAFPEDDTSIIWSDPDLQAARIEFRDVEPLRLLSRGGFGEVWLGEYMGQKVAIKRLLSDKKKMPDVLAFAAEIKTMTRLDHPKIVQFLGVCWSNAQNIQAVTEYMDCGDLRSLLDSSKASSLTWSNLKCQIAIDVVDALVYLHTLDPKMIHRDLKSRNILIDANAGAKLSDFGISRNRSVEETMTAGVGTARWIAPEVILGGHYTEFADIYSFGVVLSELDTCKTPYHDATNTNGGKMQDVTILQLVSAGKLQPSFTPECPHSITKLARACLSFSPAQRPSAIHITYELRKILKEEL